MRTAEELAELVAFMRKNGVTECDGIKLGPLPAPEKPEETPKQMEIRLDEEARKRDDILFAATSVRPIRMKRG